MQLPPPNSELCSAGKLLEVEFQSGLQSLNRAADRLEKTCERFEEKLETLSKYSIRHQGEIETLNTSMQKLEEARPCIQKLKIGFERHLAVHEEVKRQEGSSGKKWGVFSGLSAVSVLELIRLWWGIK